MTLIQTLAIPKDDRRSEFSDCKADHYFVHAYGTCNQCSSPIQFPGLDHSYCWGCKDWILLRSILNSAIGVSNSPSTSLRPPAQALPRLESKSAVVEQLELWGGVA